MANADVSKLVQIIFAGDNKLSPVAKAVRADLADVGGGVAGSVGKLSDFTLGLAKVETTLLATGAAATAFAVNMAGDFDQRFRLIATLIDQPIDALGNFRQSILDFASGSTQPIEQITEALGIAIGQGIDYGKSLDLVATAEKAAVANKASLADSTKLLVSTLNAYGFEVGDAGRVSDVFFAAIRDGAISVGDLAEGFSRVAPIAKTAGVSFEEVNAALAVLTAIGIQPSEAITYLRSAITSIITPSKEASETAAALGIQFDAQALKSKGLAGVLADVGKAAGGNIEQMGKLFGNVEGLNAALALSGTNAAQFRTEIERMKNATGATDEAFAKMARSIDLGNQRIANAFKAGLIGIGQPLLDEFNGVQNAIAAIFAVIGSSASSGNLKVFVAQLEQFAQRLQATFEAIASNLPQALASADFSAFLRGIDDVAGAVGRLFDGADLTTADGLRNAIEKAGAAFALLSGYVAGAIDGIGPFLRNLAELAKLVLEINPETVKLAGAVGGVAVALTAIGASALALGPAATAIKGLFGALDGLAVLATSGKLAGISAQIGALAGVAGVGLASYELAKYADVYGKLNDVVFGDGRTLGTALYDFVHGVDAVSESVTDGAAAVDHFSQKITDVAQGVQESGAAVMSSEAAIDRYSNTLGRTEQNLQMLGLVTDKATGNLILLSEQQQRSANLAKDAEDAARGWRLELSNGVPTYTQVGRAAADAMDRAAKGTEKAKTESEKLREKLEQIASDERIKFFEIRSKVDIAAIEGLTERVKAAFTSIDNTISSTGDSLNSLFGDLLKAGSEWDKASVTKQIDLENKRRDEALKLQKELTEAQVSEMRARTRALDRGDALIKIKTDGLEPELKALMMAVVRAMHVEASRNGGTEFLLGLPKAP